MSSNKQRSIDAHPNTNVQSSNSQPMQTSSRNHGARAAGPMSFVSFDVNSTEEARKAVRKQAALASAATRKATIARKMAQQKADGQQKIAGKAADVSVAQRTTVKQQRYSTAVPERGREVEKKSRDTKRKRLSPTPDPADKAQGDSHSSSASGDSGDNAERRVAKRQMSRAVAAYLSPERSISGSDSSDQDETALHVPGSCRCVKCTSPVSVLRHDPQPTCTTGQQNDETLWRNASWPTFLRDYRRLTEVYGQPLAHPFQGPHSLDQSKADPFNLYPVEYHPIFERLLHHMVAIFAPRGWPTLGITSEEGHEWERWMTQQALAEPAFFFVRLLFASGDLIRLNQLDPKVADWLRALSIKEINDALSDPERSISDGLILAVGRIALTESLYGDRNAASTIHRPAQKRMIDLRGGMNALGFPVLVKKLMRWADNMMAIQSGTERILGDAEETETNFGTEAGVQVLEKWVPKEGQALRKKIAISDLID